MLSIQIILFECLFAGQSLFEYMNSFKSFIFFNLLNFLKYNMCIKIFRMEVYHDIILVNKVEFPQS